MSLSILCPTESPRGVAALGGEAPEPYPLVTETPSAMMEDRSFSVAADEEE